MVRTSPLTSTRGFQLILLAIAMAVAGYVRTAVSPLQEAMRIALSLTDNEMAFLQGPIIGVPVSIAAIPLGLLIDRHARVRLLQVLIALSVVGSFMTAVASGFGVLLVARALAGVSALAILPVVLSLLADHFPPAQRGLVTMVAVIGQVVGNAAAFALGGWLLMLNNSLTAGDWRSAMLWLTVILIPLALLVLGAREPPRTGIVVANPSAKTVWRELREYRAMIAPIVVAVVMAEIAVGAMIIWASPMLSRRFSLAPDQIGGIMAIGMLASGILGPVLGGALADLCQRKGGPRSTVSALAVLAALSVPMGLFAFMPGAGMASVLLIAAMTIMLAIAVMGMTLFSVVIPNEVRGLCISVLVALEILFALSVGPPAVSLLSAAMGGLPMLGKALSIVCLVSGLFATGALLLGRRFFPRDEAAKR